MDAAAPDRLAGPIAYPWWWGAIGAACLLVAVGWVVALVALRWRRARREAAANSPEALRATWHGRIDSVERSLREGRTSPRDAALSLAGLARAWVERQQPAVAEGAEGLDDAPTLRASTGTELAVLGHPGLARLVHASYPAAFGPGDDDASMDALLAEVRRLVG